MSSNSSGKRLSGQTQIVEGSPTGEAVNVTRMAYNSIASVEYLGEAPQGTQENEPKWFLQKLLYDGSCNVTQILTASNEQLLNPITVNIDVNSDAPLVRVELIGGSFEDAALKDKLFVTTPSNRIEARIAKVVSATEVLVEAPQAIAETAAVPTRASFKNEGNDFEDLAKRRWDKRRFYVYS